MTATLLYECHEPPRPAASTGSDAAMNGQPVMGDVAHTDVAHTDVAGATL